jgi:hypothetical protein
MPGTFVTSADACDREAAWLSLPGTAQDGLPSLLVANGGPWDVVQAYQPRTPAARKGQVFVVRTNLQVERFGHVRTMFAYDFELKCRWPLSSGSGNAESDQRSFDVAIHKLCMRIRGVGPNQPGGADKTHNGAFLQVAEGSEMTHTVPGIRVHFVDPEQTITAGLDFQASVMYSADDRDFND